MLKNLVINDTVVRDESGFFRPFFELYTIVLVGCEMSEAKLVCMAGMMFID